MLDDMNLRVCDNGVTGNFTKSEIDDKQTIEAEYVIPSKFKYKYKFIYKMIDCLDRLDWVLIIKGS